MGMRLKLIKELELRNASGDETAEELQQLNDKFVAEQKELDQDLDTKSAKAHAEELMNLKKTQLKEIAAAYKELAPEDVQQEFGLHEQTRLGSLLQEYEAEVVGGDESRQEIEDMESKLREQHMDEIKKLEEETKAKMERDRVEAEMRLEEHKKKLLAEQERLKDQRLKEAGSMDAQQRELILQDMARGRQRIEDALKGEKE